MPNCPTWMPVAALMRLQRFAKWSVMGCMEGCVSWPNCGMAALTKESGLSWFYCKIFRSSWPAEAPSGCVSFAKEPIFGQLDAFSLHMGRKTSSQPEFFADDSPVVGDCAGQALCIRVRLGAARRVEIQGASMPNGTRPPESSRQPWFFHVVWAIQPFLVLFDGCATNAGVAELVDALDLGSSGGDLVKVRVLSPAPSHPYSQSIDGEGPPKHETLEER